MHMLSEEMESPIISITLDTDWAPDELIRNAIEKLDHHGIRATFFVTNECNVEFGQHEIAIHPNLKKDNDHEGLIRNLISSFPSSKGVRPHSLYTYTGIYRLYEKYGLVYCSDYIMYARHDIKPFFMVNNILQIPMFFMDDIHTIMSAEVGIKDCFSIDCLNLASQGLMVFDFHPIHLFLNTPSIEYYHKYKKFYHNPDKLNNVRCNGNGTETLFDNLLSFISDHRIKSYTLYEIYKASVDDKLHASQ